MTTQKNLRDSRSWRGWKNLGNWRIFDGMAWVIKTNVEKLRFIDKGNGRNYYTIIDGVVVDVVKVRGNFYRYVYSERLGEFIAKGEPL